MSSLAILQTLIKHSFLLYFPCELLMNFLILLRSLAGYAQQLVPITVGPNLELLTINNSLITYY